jgi:DNA polymerase-3 subunit epsilon
MRTKTKFGWFVVISASFSILVILALAILFWQQLSPPEKQFLRNFLSQYFIYFFTVGFLVFAGIGLMTDWIFRVYIIPIGKLSEEVSLIFSTNPSHRIDIEGSQDFMRLVKQINTGAEKHEALKHSVSQRINMAKKELEEEKNILAAIMAELPEAVLICNREGQIILYNTQARLFFDEQIAMGYRTADTGTNDDPDPGYEEKRFLGIGRSIFGLIDKSIIQHALEEIHTRLDRKDDNVVANFVLTAKGNRLLRAETVPILNTRSRFSGFIIIFNDITQGLRTEARAEFMLRSFQDKIRHSLASVRSAIDIIVEYPGLDDHRHKRLTEIIQTESLELEHLIQREAGENFRQSKKLWPLVPVATADLLETFKKKAEELLGITLKIEKGEGEGWIKIDTYTMVLILLFLIEHVIKVSEQIDFSCSYSVSGNFVHIDITWQGRPVKIEKLRKWETKELHIERAGLPLYLKEVLAHHEAEIWSYADRDVENRSCLRLYLPVYRPYEMDAARHVAVLPENRPEFYNFDLFNQPGQNKDMDHCPLMDLDFTVFDTETTGLNPSAGDRIISIGAVRIVKLRMLKEESFDQLINPYRNIPLESTKIHGIHDAMVRFKPGIDSILPMFYQFAADTILVAHNAAFDMRMLQTCEVQTGIKFINSVLDTLLLSAVVHPNQDDHSLEAIAGRLGIEIHDRHTAMGDATLTGEIFLKLIPLLESMGLRTLKEVREASKKTYYARLKY